MCFALCMPQVRIHPQTRQHVLKVHHASGEQLAWRKNEDASGFHLLDQLLATLLDFPVPHPERTKMCL